jgi:hypothetical protein
MLASYVYNPVNAESKSATLAKKLRTGPVRTILDRLVRSAAEATGLPYMVLGIRYGEFYEFISTYGIPLSHYRDQVPAHAFAPHLFNRDIEVSDLQNHSHFTVLSVVPVAGDWRYGANSPVRLHYPLSDDGVLALSCADYKTHEKDGRILATLRTYSDTISDLIWMCEQLEQAIEPNDPTKIIRSILLPSLSYLSIKICVIDSNLNIISLSKPFLEKSLELGGTELRIGQSVICPWLSDDLIFAIKQSFANNKQYQRLNFEDKTGIEQNMDVYTVSFGEMGTYAVLALQENDRSQFAVSNHISITEVRDISAVTTGFSHDGVGPVSRFLLDTLPIAQRLNRRGQTSYIGLRKWRTAIKQYQIEALRALKEEMPAGFVSAVADELADSVRSVYGDVDQCVVVPVPCGSSGSDCLSCRLAAGLARRLGVPMVRAFEQIKTPPGSSHPRRNINRSRMKLLEKIERPVILVDDVATSGSHIDEAATLLRKTSPHVWPVVWIST